MSADVKSVAFADAFVQRGFVQLPNDVLLNPDLDPGAKVTFAGLMHFAWKNEGEWPGQEEMGRRLNVSERSMRTHLQKLQSLGFLDITRRGQGLTNLYRLKLPIQAATSAVPEQQALPVPVENEKTSLQDTVRDREIDDVWAHWLVEFPGRWKFDAKRKRIIKSALDVRDVSQCKLAITGLKNSPYHNGQNDSKTKYIDIQYALKGRGAQSDESVIDRMAEIGAKHSGKPALNENGVPQNVQSRFNAMLRLYDNRDNIFDFEETMSRMAGEVAGLGWRVVFVDGMRPESVEQVSA